MVKLKFEHRFVSKDHPRKDKGNMIQYKQNVYKATNKET